MRTSRPPLVRILARKPCVLRLLIRLGWYVRFIPVYRPSEGHIIIVGHAQKARPKGELIVGKSVSMSTPRTEEEPIALLSASRMERV